MPATFFTFKAGTGGVPAANFDCPVGAVPVGALIVFMVATDVTVFPSASSGDVVSPATGIAHPRCWDLSSSR